jgi:hypothetical protein
MFAAQSALHKVDPDGVAQMGHSAKQSKLGSPMTGREVRAVSLQ